MEGEFLRGVVHGKATYYLDNGTRCSVEKRTKKLNLFLLSRFIGLFRKGVPHGRALVIGEDGKQVKVHALCRLFERLNILLNTFCQRL